MEPLLLVVTVGSLLAALIMSAAAWRLSREERARSAARVAALAASAAETPVPEPRVPIAPRTAPPVAVEAASTSDGRSPWAQARIPAIPKHVGHEQREGHGNRKHEGHEGHGGHEGHEERQHLRSAVVVAPPAPRAPDLVPHHPAMAEEPPSRPEPSSRAAAMGDSFLGGSHAPSEGSGRQRGLAIAASVLFVVLAGGGYWVVFGDRGTTASASAVATSGAPLELVSMRHERHGARLSVSGLVRNPVAGEAVDRLTAVVFLFDQQGGFVTSSRAEVDFKRLVPGDESPFVIAMDAPTSVARYRVSFRTDAGVVTHVDRRGQDPAAPNAVGQNTGR